jgi:predicted DNA-binding protein (UPF0251 family)
VRHEPAAVHFKPAGIPLRALEEVSVGLDELEAMRLADVEGLTHEEVGRSMGVSRATAGRILAGARRKVSEALARGWAIRVEGGVVETVLDEELPYLERGCGRRRRRRRGGRD